MRKYNIFKSLFCVILILWTGIGLELKASPIDNNPKTIFECLQGPDVIEISLKTNFTELIENKNEDLYQKAKFGYTDAYGNFKERKIKVKARGKFRKKVCDFPPLKLKFSKEGLIAEGLKDDNKLKLVTHCFEGNAEEGEQNLLKEYLVYKMLNILTEKSYQVQLVRVTYVDTEDHYRFQRYGFLIESTKALETRLDGIAKKIFSMPIQDLERKQYNTVTMFQYMVSNTDWHVEYARNVKFILPKEGNKVTLVPYDFDFSGVVNAGYAIVNPNYPVSDLRDRFFLGHFNDAEALNETLGLFREKKTTILSLWRNFEPLKKRHQRDVINYLETFFELIEDDKVIRQELLEVEG